MEGWSRLCVARGEERTRPRHEERQGKQVRARQQVSQYQRAAQHDRDQGRERFGVTQQETGQEREAEGEGGCGQQGQPTPPGRVVDGSQDELGEPFMRHPDGAGERMRERVVHRQSCVGKHPPAGSDMKIGVGIVEQCGGLGERPDEYGEPDDQRPGRDEPAPYIRAVSGLTHGQVSRGLLLGRSRARVLPGPPPIDRNDTDINQRGKGDAFVDVEVTLAAIPSSDPCRCGLHARGLHRAFLFGGHQAHFPFSPHSTICQDSVAQSLTGR